MKKIAVLLNDQLETASPDCCTKAAIYDFKEQSWRMIEEIPVRFDLAKGMTQVRKELQSFAQKLDECRIIIGRSFTGLPYQIFNRLNFAIFEADALSEAVLSEIAADVDSVKKESTSGSQISPTATDVPGVFFLDLIAMQKQHPEISSKMALQSFLSGNPFIRIDVLCRHMPPWLEKMAQEKKIRVAAERISQDAVKVYITKYSC